MACHRDRSCIDPTLGLLSKLVRAGTPIQNDKLRSRYGNLACADHATMSMQVKTHTESPASWSSTEYSVKGPLQATFLYMLSPALDLLLHFFCSQWVGLDAISTQTSLFSQNELALVLLSVDFNLAYAPFSAFLSASITDF